MEKEDYTKLVNEHKDIFNRLLQQAKIEFPNESRERILYVAAARTKTWVDFINDPKNGMPLLRLFEALGEISSLKIDKVSVEYFTEPSIVVQFSYKDRNNKSELMYEEAKSELEFALKNRVDGVEKLSETMERLELELVDTRKIRKVGNSLVVSIPESIVGLFGLKEGEHLSFLYRFGTVKVKKATMQEDGS